MRYFNDGMEIVFEDFNDLSKALLKGLHDRVIYEMLQRNENSFFGTSFKVGFSNSNTLTVAKGLGFQTNAAAVSPEMKRSPIALEENTTVGISAPHASLNRKDIVCVKSLVISELSATRNYKDANDGSVSQEEFVVQKDFSHEFLVVAGTPSGSPAVPATPDGYIKIAEVDVTAVSGVANADAITDRRNLMPVGSDSVINTLGYGRLTAGASTPISTLFGQIDTLLKFGYFNYLDVDEINDPTAEPASPAASKRRMFFRDGVLYLKNSAGVKTPVGSSSGGGGAGANWKPGSGNSAIESYEYDDKVWLFENGLLQQLNLWIRVPSGYIAGRQITMKGCFYSPSNTNNFQFQTVTTLIRKNTDSIADTTNQESADSGDILNAVAHRVRELSFNLTDGLGTVNDIPVSSGDILKVSLIRIAPTGAADTNDVRFIPGSTEVSF